MGGMNRRFYVREVKSQGERRSGGLNCAPFSGDWRAQNPMPTYEYTCEKCGKNFEAFQSMRDEPYKTCPKELCQQKRWGKGKVKRLLGTGAGVIFKGSGFYSTDYRSKSYQEAAKKDAPQTSGGDKSGAAKESSGSDSSASSSKPAESKPNKPVG